jgi:hypothetical protein
MPRFYFNYRNRDRITQELITAKDDEGLELSGLDAARANATASAREMVADNVRSDSGHPMETLFVTDEGGRELLSISAQDVLPPTIR